MAAALHRQALRIFQAALRAADPVPAVLRHVRREGEVLIAGGRRYDLDSVRNVYVIGAGKASARIAVAVEQLLGRRITAGLINAPNANAPNAVKLRRVEINQCGHPVPDRRGVAGARRIAQIASDAGPDDLIVCLISGGASALLPLPAPPITLAEKQAVTQLLLHCGANIHEMNCVRKHLSLIKGGHLARLAYPATLLTLILSDVIGDDLDVIGSGPTAPDPTTFRDARAIFEKFRIWNQLPRAVRGRILSMAGTATGETPKPGDRIFRKTRNVIVGSNALAVDAAAREARRLGFHTLVLSTFLEGEAREAARVHASIAKEIRASGRPVKPPACVITGGETTVTVRGKGRGGRNQEFALASALAIAGLRDTVILSAGTDGSDGPTSAAGAIADGTTVARAEALGRNAAAFLASNDSYSFFDALGDLIETGPTGTNVADIQLILVSEPRP
jgi:hydroxypyruvate reductase